MIFKQAEHEWQDLGDGIKRKIVGYTGDLMAVHLCFDKGAIGTLHHHEQHDQIGYVLAGRFEVILEDKKQILNMGDAYIVAKLANHGVVALEENSMLLDMFSPIRSDFIVS